MTPYASTPQTTKRPHVVVIGTLDTKGAEIAYVRDRIRQLGAEPLVVDSGILGEAAGCQADVPREQVAEEAGSSLDVARAAPSRGRAIERVRQGVRAGCL